jgi:hypothetical protein
MSRTALLLDILGFARPHGSKTEKRFCREFLDKVDGMQRDGFGNRYLRIGTAPILWSCHVDTVAKHGGPQLLAYEAVKQEVTLAKGRAGMSLGADDGAGIYIMLNMIEAGIEGLYIFHRGEEVGCLGSRWIVKNTPELLDGIDAAIAFDRAGTDDVITDQINGQTASVTFAQSLADLLNGADAGFRYRPDDTGVYTDTNEYAEHIRECTNLSVGYYGQHGPRERLDVGHCERLLDAVLAVDWSKLVIERIAGDFGHYTHGYDNRGWKPAKSKPKVCEELLDAVRKYPAAVARMLTHLDLDVWDVLEEVDWLEMDYEEEHEHEYGF